MYSISKCSQYIIQIYHIKTESFSLHACQPGLVGGSWLFRRLHIRVVFLYCRLFAVKVKAKGHCARLKGYTLQWWNKNGYYHLNVCACVCLCIRIHVRVFICWAILSRGSQWKRWQLCAPVRLWCWRFVGCSLSLIPNVVICVLQSCCKERHSWKLCSSLSTCTVGGAERCLLL